MNASNNIFIYDMIKFCTKTLKRIDSICIPAIKVKKMIANLHNFPAIYLQRAIYLCTFVNRIKLDQYRFRGETINYDYIKF